MILTEEDLEIARIEIIKKAMEGLRNKISELQKENKKIKEDLERMKK